MADFFVNGRRVDDLLVKDLKEELEKRGLSKGGNKSVLVQRLKDALVKEGQPGGAVTPAAQHVQVGGTTSDIVSEYYRKQQEAIEAATKAKNAALAAYAAASSVEISASGGEAASVAAGSSPSKQHVEAAHPQRLTSPSAQVTPAPIATGSVAQMAATAMAPSDFSAATPTGAATTTTSEKRHVRARSRSRSPIVALKASAEDDARPGSTAGHGESKSEEAKKSTPVKSDVRPNGFEEEREELNFDEHIDETRGREEAEELQFEKEDTRKESRQEATNDDDKRSRKRKWGTTKTTAAQRTVLISTESLKGLIGPLSSEAPPTTAADSETLQIEVDASADDTVSSTVTTTAAAKRIVIAKEGSVEESRNGRKRESNKRDSPDEEILVDQTEAKKFTITEYGLKRARAVSPPRNAVSSVVHITHLTRPYTVKMLMELLGKFGSVDEKMFWIDAKKSECLAKFETDDEAEKARNELHHVEWPPSNPRVLRVEFSTLSELESRMAGGAREAPNAAENKSRAEVVQEPKKEDSRDRRRLEERRDERRSRSRERLAGGRVGTRRSPVIGPGAEKRRKHDDSPPAAGQTTKKEERKIWSSDREWDKGKDWPPGGSPPPAPGTRREDERRKRRSPTPERGRDRERGRREEGARAQEDAQPPAKLLDELFRKTKAMPCIYWLPLTDEQVMQKENERNEQEAAKASQKQRRPPDDGARRPGAGAGRPSSMERGRGRR